MGAIVGLLSYGCRGPPFMNNSNCRGQDLLASWWNGERPRFSGLGCQLFALPCLPSNEKLSHRFRLGVCLVNQPLSFCDVAALPRRVICYPIVPSRWSLALFHNFCLHSFNGRLFVKRQVCFLRLVYSFNIVNSWGLLNFLLSNIVD